MTYSEAAPTGALFQAVLRDLPYYNSRAKTAELARYSVGCLQDLIRSDPTSVIVAKMDREIIGFCFSREDDGLIWMSWIGVQPNYRRKRIATALIRSLIARASQLGAHKIWCDCRTNNEISVRALVSNGFRQLCTISNHWHGQDFILWEKLVAI
jgi:ribosomal protein S18 acetylase RimI-like enzyme